MGGEDVPALRSGHQADGAVVLALLTFRSIVIRIKAIVLNQRGNLASLLHFKPRVPTAV